MTEIERSDKFHHVHCKRKCIKNWYKIRAHI